MNDGWVTAEVVARRALNAQVVELALAPLAGTVAPWAAGAHLRVAPRGADGGRLGRHYSLVDVPAAAAAGCDTPAAAAGSDVPAADPAPRLWRIAVKRLPAGRGGSAAMTALQPGDRLDVSGPLNHFEVSLTAPQTVLVAGGIGITPMPGIARRLARSGRPLALHHAVRDEADLLYAGELRALLGAGYIAHVGAAGRRLDLPGLVASLAPQAQLVVCGPLAMLREARRLWREAGRPPQRLRIESFGGGGGGDEALPFSVQIPRQGLAFEVPAGQSLLEALEAQGVPMLSECRQGACGLCAVDVLGCTSRIDHRDLFFGDAADERAHRLCSCVSRAAGGTLVIDTAWRPENPPQTRARTQTPTETHTWTLTQTHPEETVA